MHETMVAQNVLAAILAESAKINAKPLSAKISCGQLNPINDEVLSFAFEAAAKGTICQAMKLRVVHIPLRGTCKKCGEMFEFDIYSPACGNCGSDDFEIAPDAELLLEEIEFEDSE